MNYIISIFYLALAIFMLYKIKMYQVSGISKHWFAAAFGYKVILAVAMLFIYTRSADIKEKADIFRFSNDAQVLYRSIKVEPSAYFKIMSGVDADDLKLFGIYDRMNNWDYSNGNQLFSNNRMLIRYLAFINLITFGSYGADLIITLLLAFTGLFWIFKFFNSKLKQKKWLLFVLIFFTPSVAFWTSGILKESLLIFAIGLIFNCGNYALKGRKPIARIGIVLLALLLIYNIKEFAFFLLLPPLLAYVWNHFRSKQRPILPYLALIILGLAIANESGKFGKENIYKTMIEKQLSFYNLAEQDNANSSISPIVFDATTQSVLLNSPIALINSLFRPMLWEANNPLMIVSALENLGILVLVLLVVLFPVKKLENPNLFWFTLVFSISYLIVIGLTTPVLGAISRYRVPALLFFLLALLQLIDVESIKTLLQRNKV